MRNQVDKSQCIKLSKCDKNKIMKKLFKFYYLLFLPLYLFRCSVCVQEIAGTFFEKDGLIFCQKDYWNVYGEQCHNCQHIISGPVMVSRCFICDMIIGSFSFYVICLFVILDYNLNVIIFSCRSETMLKSFKCYI